MNEIDHALILCILGQVRSFKGEMNIHGACSLINEKEEDKYTIWELVYELWINYAFYKENTKFSELNSFYWVQWFIWGEILYLMDLWMNHGRWGEFLTQKPYLSNQVIAVYAILNKDISLLASNLYYIFNSECIKCIYQANLVYLLLSWTKPSISEP